LIAIDLMKEIPMKNIRFFVVALMALVVGFAAQAQTRQPLVDVQGAWARATVPGQTASGAFFKIKAQQALTLVGVTTPVAGLAEVHEMKSAGGVVQMRPVGALDLPAGRTIEFKPGGYHVMLMELKLALSPNSRIPLTLILKDAQGHEIRQNVQADVRAVK
jgi:copper(I)-binding protein